MSDPNDILPPISAPGLLKRETGIDISESIDDQNLITAGIGLAAGALITGRLGLAAKLFTIGTTLHPQRAFPFLRPTAFTYLLGMAPLPFGFAPSETYGLRKNYLRRFARDELGIPEDVIPESSMLATKKDNPAIEFDFNRVMREKVEWNYERNAPNLTLGQLRADYDLFSRAARGELGPVAPNLPVAKLADIAAEVYAQKRSHLFITGAGQFTDALVPDVTGNYSRAEPAPVIPPIEHVLPPINTAGIAVPSPVTPTLPGTNNAALIADLRQRALYGGDVLSVPESSAPFVYGGDPIPPQPVKPPSDPYAPPTDVQQREAAAKAPDLVRHLLSERNDP